MQVFDKTKTVEDYEFPMSGDVCNMMFFLYVNYWSHAAEWPFE